MVKENLKVCDRIIKERLHWENYAETGFLAKTGCRADRLRPETQLL
jgi:hypothetical protein